MSIWSILEYTTAISIVGLLILGMKRIFHDKLDARWHYFIWLVLLVRMIVPVDFDWIRTPLSIFQQLPVEKWFEKSALLMEKWGYGEHVQLIWTVYLCGALALTAVYLISWLALGVKIMRAPEADAETYAYVQEIAEKYRLKGCKRIRICESNTPYIFGVFAPILVLPANHVRPQEAIIVHELLHMRCKDVLINLALHVVRVINWFNPFVWMLCSMVQNDSEALCDQRVLERCGREQASEYGEMLIYMTAGRRPNPVKIGTSNMASSFKNVKTRIQRIKDFRSVPADIGFVTLCITLVLTVASIGSSAEEYNTLKIPVINSRRDLERGLLEARCYHAPTPHQAIYLFLRGTLERNLFYRMAVMPQEHVEGFENFAKICLEAGLVNEEDYGSVETWDPEEYSPYYPKEMYELSAFTIYGLQYDEEKGSATVQAIFQMDDSGEDYAEWKLELTNEDGWKVWLTEETGRIEESANGAYVPEPLIYGCSMLGDFKVEIMGYNSGEFRALNNQWYTTWFNQYPTATDEEFPLFYGWEIQNKRLYMTYVGDEDLTGRQIAVVSGGVEDDVDTVSLVVEIKDVLTRMLEEAKEKAEETGDKLIVEDAQNLVNEVMAKVVGNERLTRADLEEIGKKLGIVVEENTDEQADITNEYLEVLKRLDEIPQEDYVDWTHTLYGSVSTSDGKSYQKYEGEELMSGKRNFLSGGGSGYDEPGHGWTAEDEISAYVKIYINGELVQEGYVWSQNH